jgi:uncharacterized protein
VLADGLREALRVALKSRDRVAVAALRSALAAIENASAVPAAGRGGLAIEESPAGPGAADVARRELTESDMTRIIRSEVADREAAARDYEAAGRTERAAHLRAEADALRAHLCG